jgi:hypothetical protein
MSQNGGMLTAAVKTVINDGFQQMQEIPWQAATNRNVAGSIPDVGFSYWHNPSGRTMALGSTQPLTEMSTRNISWG